MIVDPTQLHSIHCNATRLNSVQLNLDNYNQMFATNNKTERETSRYICNGIQFFIKFSFPFFNSAAAKINGSNRRTGESYTKT